MKIDTLKLDEKVYSTKTLTQDGDSITYRAFENIVYVTRPVDRHYQSLCIYVPQPYYEGEMIGPYTKETAPIFMPNTVGGYMPGRVDEPINRRFGEINAIFIALSRGYVVVSPGIRGRGLHNDDGHNTGFAPASIVDYKAAVRYIRRNRKKIPGDTEKIVSNGTSAGGALSALLGSTGNHPDYEPYLVAVGAARERDDIFIASCYCPITNLEHGDMAYEWEFSGINDYHRISFEPQEGEPGFREIAQNGHLTEQQTALSEQEKALFPDYVNSLGLKNSDREPLSLDYSGNGTLKEEIVRHVLHSAQDRIDRGADLSATGFLTIEKGKAVSLDWAKFIQYRTRMKDVPAFDSIFLTTPENELFGTPQVQSRHFTSFSKAHSAVNGEMAEAEQIKMMNPMRYIHDAGARKAPYFRIRHGTVDRDTSLAIPTLLAASLRESGVNVDYGLPWGVAHAGDYDLTKLFDYIDRCVAGGGMSS